MMVSSVPYVGFSTFGGGIFKGFQTGGGQTIRHRRSFCDLSINRLLVCGVPFMSGQNRVNYDDLSHAIIPAIR